MTPMQALWSSVFMTRQHCILNAIQQQTHSSSVTFKYLFKFVYIRGQV